MNGLRRSWIVCVLFCLVLSFAQVSLAQEATPEAAQEVELVTTQINDNFYVITTSNPMDSTIVVHIGEDGTLLVDSHWSFNNPMIMAAVEGITDQPVRYVIDTHWHPDHTDGNANFNAVGALLMAHHTVRTRMANGQVIELFQVEVAPYPEEALPELTFTDAVTLHVNGEAVQVLFTAAAHTDGDAIVYFPQGNVIHMGDVYIPGTYPFVDVSSGGNALGFFDVIERAVGLINPDTVVVPGHGQGLATTADLQAYLDMLRIVRDRIETGISDGLTLEDIIAQSPTAEFVATYGLTLIPGEQFVAWLYEALTASGSEDGETQPETTAEATAEGGN